MKSYALFGIALGLAISVLPSIVRAEDPMPSAQPSAAVQPQTPEAVTRPQALPPRQLTVDEAKQELTEARAAYRTAVRTHGKNSPTASVARQRLDTARSVYRETRRQQRDAAVQGGGGTTGGGPRSGRGQIR